VCHCRLGQAFLPVNDFEDSYKERQTGMSAPL
jgi:hypothetical protein